MALGSYSHSKVATVADHLKDRQRIDELLKKNLKEAMNSMEVYADKKRSAREVEVGDCVYLRRQPYRQNSVEMMGNSKLSAKYLGPYQIVQQIGKVAYRL